MGLIAGAGTMLAVIIASITLYQLLNRNITELKDAIKENRDAIAESGRAISEMRKNL